MDWPDLEPSCNHNLAHAIGMLDAVRKTLAVSVTSILHPPQTTQEYRRQIDGTWRLVDVPHPITPRQSVAHHLKTLTDGLAVVDRELELARIAAVYGMWSTWGWGDAPPIIRLGPHDPDDPRWKTARDRLAQYRRDTAAKRRALETALEVLEKITRIPHGTEFRAVSRQAGSRLRLLSQGPHPFVEQIRRDADGWRWKRL